jgi:hypothetical protein
MPVTAAVESVIGALRSDFVQGMGLEPGTAAVYTHPPSLRRRFLFPMRIHTPLMHVK